jgi:hypothetical protein
MLATARGRLAVPGGMLSDSEWSGDINLRLASVLPNSKTEPGIEKTPLPSAFEVDTASNDNAKNHTTLCLVNIQTSH